MYTYYGNFQFKVLDYLVKLLQADTYLTSMVGKRISTYHPSTIDQPVFPSITIGRQGMGGDASLEQIDNAFLIIDIWSQQGVANLWAIYSSADPSTRRPVGVRSLLHNQGFDITEAVIDKLSEAWVTDNLYEKDTRLYHMQARYQMKSVSKTLVLP